MHLAQVPNVADLPERVIESQNAALMLSLFCNLALGIALAYLWRHGNKTSERLTGLLVRSAASTQQIAALLEKVSATNHQLAGEIDDLKGDLMRDIREIRDILAELRGRNG